MARIANAQIGRVAAVSRTPSVTAPPIAITGAQALIISLWRVPDRQTQALMTNFYARLQGDPQPDLVEALRQSKLWLKKSQPEVHPRAWASFILSIE